MFVTNNAQVRACSWGSAVSVHSTTNVKTRGISRVGHGVKFTLRNFALISASPYLGAVCLGRDSSGVGMGYLGSKDMPSTVFLTVINPLVFNSFLH